MLRSLFRRTPEAWPSQPNVGGQVARVPPGVCVYAIGDIHGRADLLEVLHRQVAADAVQLTPGTERLVLYVGDYVDRGLESRQVIDLLIHQPLADFHPIYLLGNHDAWLLSFLIDAKVGATWLRYGGDATLHSYGVRLRQPVDELQYYEELQAELRERLPRRHIEFLEALELSYETGDYLFVHAGVRPDVPLERQTADDLLWIREPFLSCQARSRQGRGPWPHGRGGTGGARQSHRDRHRRLLDRLPHLPGAGGGRATASSDRRRRPRQLAMSAIMPAATVAPAAPAHDARKRPWPRREASW